MSQNQNDKIVIRGARVHNLKNIDIDIPRNKFVVITGVSGSGKSSLAFDTIHAEGQRRYVESLSSYARQFLNLMDKPDVDKIEGLSPTIAISQRTVARNPRSTVGTITEIYDYLRVLFSRAGNVHCPKCGQKLFQQNLNQIASKIMAWGEGTKVLILAPVIKSQRGEHKNILRETEKANYKQVRIDGQIYSIEEALDLSIDNYKKHNLEIVIADFKISDEKNKLKEILKVALELGNGVIIVQKDDEEKDIMFSQYFACPNCEINLTNFEPRDFSFNSPQGACSSCTGLGNKLKADPELIIPNQKLTLAQGAIRPWSRQSAGQSKYNQLLEAVAKENKFSVHSAIKDLSKKYVDLIFNGTGSKKYKIEIGGKEIEESYIGVIADLEERYKNADSDYMRTELEKYMRVYRCPACDGQRLKPESLAVKVADHNIAKITTMSIDLLNTFFVQLSKNSSQHFSKANESVAKPIIEEIIQRVSLLVDVGLDYLTLGRAANSLSGGELQRIHLSTQIGSALTGVIYVLDEPSIGLHDRDVSKLISTLKTLRDLGNTVVVVEHDRKIMEAADEVVDIGPGAGKLGGEIISHNVFKKILTDKKSLTGLYLSGKKQISFSRKHRKGNGKQLIVRNAAEFNLKGIDVRIPLGRLVCLTGVSGSGKSTLVNEILTKALSHYFYRAKDLPGKHEKIEGLQHIDKMISIDQSAIGRTPRSNPATYSGVFTHIRDLFSQIAEAKIRGYKTGHFSFNVKGGRCEACAGDGSVKIEMHFLSDVYVKCKDCDGKRFKSEILEIHYRGKNIAEILEMSIDDAMKFFRHLPNIYNKLKILHDVGLGYVQLGQSATTLSGGEAQRIKLATELSRRSTGKTLYILDEPTTGLHFDDIKKLLDVLNKLTDKGNTVLVVEHNLDVIRSADWVIDLGPEGGDRGGEIVVEGIPKDVAKCKKGYTGKFLKEVLE